MPANSINPKRIEGGELVQTNCIATLIRVYSAGHVDVEWGTPLFVLDRASNTTLVVLYKGERWMVRREDVKRLREINVAVAKHAKQ